MKWHAGMPFMIRSRQMLRWIIPLLAVLVAAQNASAADQIVVRQRAHPAVGKLPPGLPHAHYNYRTTIVTEERDPDALLSPSVPTTPLLLGSSALPGNYGRAFSYDYQGAYYGGSSYVPYLFRLPYACGVTGYC
jgi:hypothetical protein